VRRFIETTPCTVSRFEVLWTDTAQMTVTARSIVKGIDVVGHLGSRQLSVLVDLLLEPLLLQTAEEQFGESEGRSRVAYDWRAWLTRDVKSQDKGDTSGSLLVG